MKEIGMSLGGNGCTVEGEEGRRAEGEIRIAFNKNQSYGHMYFTLARPPPTRGGAAVGHLQPPPRPDWEQEVVRLARVSTQVKLGGWSK
jgi:hypothetical protein